MIISKLRIISILLLIAGSSICQAQKGYHVLHAFPAGGDGKWDYLAINPATGKLYVAHGTQVNILDKETGAATGTIDSTHGVHGIAFAPRYGKGFTSNGKANNVTVFDISSNAVTAHVATGENPDAIMYDAFADRIFVCNGKGKSMTVINPADNEVVATIALNGKPETAVTDGKGSLFVNIEDKNEIVVINTARMTVEKHWPLGKGEAPSGLAIDKKNGRLFAGCDNKLMVIVDLENGRVIQDVAIGDGCDGVMYDADRKLVFSSNGEGTLMVIDAAHSDHYSVKQILQTQKGAKTLTLDEKTGIVYLPVADFMPQETAPDKPTAKKQVKPGSFKIIVVGP